MDSQSSNHHSTTKAVFLNFGEIFQPIGDPESSYFEKSFSLIFLVSSLPNYLITSLHNILYQCTTTPPKMTSISFFAYHYFSNKTKLWQLENQKPFKIRDQLCDLYAKQILGLISGVSPDPCTQVFYNEWEQNDSY